MSENLLWLLLDVRRARKQGPAAIAQRQSARLAEMAPILVLEVQYMITHGVKRLFSLLLFAFWFWSVQGLAAQEINYKLIPNLQQMKDSSPTPDFTLPDPAGKKVSLKDFRGKLVMLNFGPLGVSPVAKKCPQWSAFTRSLKIKVL